ncbi:MAG: serine/threonine-protein kinase, partial [Pseudomonadota bacterium]
MKAPVDPIERFAARLADGEPIDWQEAEQFLPPEALQQLRELAELTRVMRTAGGSTVDVVRELDHWGHLKIQDCLGSGQFGEVFRAFDPILRRDVSLKLSRGNIEVDPASWIEEARQLARVRHPHVLAVHGADIHDGEPGLWADLIMGQTLTDHRREHSPSTEKRLSLMLQLARALRAVHRQGLAHGDVKPANVMIEPNDRAILMDFGSARDLNAKVDATRATGTPLYMAPERLAGNRASPAADVFALGGVFVFLLTGRPPFPASSVEQLISLHKSRSLVSLKGMACSRAERRLIQAMLNPNTEQRPDIDEVIGDLERIQTAPGRRRRALAVGTIIILLAAGLTAATIGFVNVRQAERETTAMNELLREVLVAPRGTELGREARVVDVLDRALFQAERRFGNQPEILARVQYLVGDTLQSLTQHDEAKPLLEQAYEEYLQRYGPTDARTLDLLNAIAEVEKDLGNPDRAEALWQKILEGSDTATTAGRVQSLLAHARLANLSMERNELDAALD